MNKIVKSLTKISVMFFVLLVVSFSCTKKISFMTSPIVPAARGNVQVKKDNNKNYVIDVNLLDLAEVNRLSPPKQTYVVWMITEENITRNIGQINSKPGMLSKKLKASFETVSAFKPIKIFITAEDDANILSPSGQTVLTTENF